MPSFQVALTETPCTHNTLGVKGCGEAGAIGAPPAVMNAITDAIGVRISMPATPEKVWRALQRPADAAGGGIGRHEADVRVRVSSSEDRRRGRLAASGRDPTAKLLAGGHTLIPTLKQRLASPSDLIDLGAIAELKGILVDRGRAA